MLTLGAVCNAQAQAQLPAASATKLWRTVGDDKLDSMRGGFDLGAGMMVSFGVTRAVYVNGALVATTSFQVADVGRLTSTQAQQFGNQLAGLNLVQNGPGNVFQATLPSSTLATFVQNTLDNQRIQSRTVIDATTNGASLVRGINTGAAIQAAVRNSIGGR